MRRAKQMVRRELITQATSAGENSSKANISHPGDCVGRCQALAGSRCTLFTHQQLVFYAAGKQHATTPLRTQTRTYQSTEH